MILIGTVSSLFLIDRFFRLCCKSFQYPNEASNRMTLLLFQTLFTVGCVYGFVTTRYPSNHYEESKTMHLQIHPDSYECTSTVPYSYMNWISHTMAGYFIYDLLFLFSLTKERAQPLFVFHHLLSLLIYGINQVKQAVPDRESYFILALLEVSSPLINLLHLWKERYPNWSGTRNLFSLLKTTYGLSRVVGMFVWLRWYISYATYKDWTWNHIGNGSSFVTVYLASIYWYISMLRKK